jgi:hypothetical protein
VNRRLNECRNEKSTLESLNPEDQLQWRMTKRVTRLPTPSTPDHTGGISPLASEKAKALADSVEGRFQPVNVLSVSAVIEIFDVELRS